MIPPRSHSGIALAFLVTLALCTPAFSQDPQPPASQPPASATVILAVGAAGEESFGHDFARWTERWLHTCAQAGAQPILIGPRPTPAAALPSANPPPPNVGSDRDRLRHVLAEQPTESNADLWLVLVGHGTFDGREARFNLEGPDLTAQDLADWLQPFRRPLVILNTASSSSPFLQKLSAQGRVIITATRSGYEENYARFGGHFVAAITDPTADLDKDEQVSLLEAFVLGSRRLAEWYAAEGRLATEHALLDDNGDGVGTPADWFRGVRAIKKPEGGAAVDGVRAHQVHLVRSAREQTWPAEWRARRDALEAALASLRALKPTLEEPEYLRRLEVLLRDLAPIYAADP